MRVGAGNLENYGWGFAAGAGLKINAWKIWNTYDDTHKDMTWAVGLSEWDWFKRYLLYLGMGIHHESAKDVIYNRKEKEDR